MRESKTERKRELSTAERDREGEKMTENLQMQRVKVHDAQE